MTTKCSLSRKIAALLMTAAIIIATVSVGMSAFAVGVLNTGDSSNKASIIFSPQGAGLINYVIGSRSSRAQSKYVNSFPIGTNVKLTATERSGSNAAFLYWYNVYTDRVVSYETVIEFTLTTKTQIYAVFVTPLEGHHYIVYLNYAGSILFSGDCELGSMAQQPADSEMVLPGFTFSGWDKSIGEVTNSTETMVVRPRYTLNSQNYTVSLTNTANVSGAGTYGNYDTVMISADAQNDIGEDFSCWRDGNGKVVSYDREYTFRINYDAEFTAVYGETVTPEPITRMSKVVTDVANSKITFFAERSIPEGYKLLQHGILISSSASIEMILQAVSLGDGATVKRGTGISNEACGTYSLTKINAVSGTIYYCRAYAVCENSAGTQYVFYSDTTSASI